MRATERCGGLPSKACDEARLQEAEKGFQNSWGAYRQWGIAWHGTSR